MADALFEEPRLARIYDAVDGDRTDLDTYVSLIESLGARSALDIGCGTGTLACRLAARGLDVTAVDPAAASPTSPAASCTRTACAGSRETRPRCLRWRWTCPP
jgi:SAM-dependent methyltransferase